MIGAASFYPFVVRRHRCWLRVFLDALFVRTGESFLSTESQVQPFFAFFVSIEMVSVIAFSLFSVHNSNLQLKMDCNGSLMFASK